MDIIATAGCNFPNCPRITLYEASERDYRLVLIGDAVSGIYEQGRWQLERIVTHYLDSEDFQTWGAGKPG
jgi:nicotinamidase-related amidase